MGHRVTGRNAKKMNNAEMEKNADNLRVRIPSHPPFTCTGLKFKKKPKYKTAPFENGNEGEKCVKRLL